MFDQLNKPFRYKRISVFQGDVSQNQHMKGKERPKNWTDTIKRIWSYLAVHQTFLWLVVTMVIISSFLSLLGPFLIGMAIDDFIATYNVSGLFHVLLSLFIIYLLYSLSIWLQSFWMIGVAQKTVSELRRQLFQKMQQLPLSYLDKKQHGELMSRLTNDIDNVSTTLNTSVIQILSSLLTFIGIIIVMFYLSPLLTIITLLVVPLMVLGMKWITRRTSVFFKEQQRHLGEVNGFIEETISGQRIVKAFSQEEKVINEFHNKSERLKGASFWAQTYSGFIPKLMNVLNNLSFAFIAAVGGILAFNGYITVGVIVIFTEYSRQFTRPLNDLANQFNTLLSAVAGAERVFHILDEQEEKDEEGAKQLGEVKGAVSFKHVTFSYTDGQQTVKDISFEVNPGETVALVGPTGAGKTTIINLLSRFYDADSGEILLDNQNLSSIKRSSLRQHTGIVLQDSFLFQGTIRENIRYGRLEASDEEVVLAAKEANAYSFISKLPEQFDTVLEQDHTGISQGQKQLISIARVMLANPSILILDEATSNIDTITEIKIQEALERLMQGRTSFIIAHRMNTIKNSDQIIVLDQGKLIEKGSHQQLLKEKGFYHEMIEQVKSNEVSVR